jgi:hypothetical protein
MQEICTSGSVGGRLALVASRSTRPWAVPRWHDSRRKTASKGLAQTEDIADSGGALPTDMVDTACRARRTMLVIEREHGARRRGRAG